MISSASAWIGLWAKTVDGSFQWIDGTSGNYLRWFEDEPNNHFDMESCVAMYSNHSKDSNTHMQKFYSM